MNRFLFSFILACTLNVGFSQVTTKVEMPMDSSKADCHMYKNILSGGGKYLFNSSKNTRTLLADAGYSLDQVAIEYFVRYKNLPKLFYFQQTGTINNAKYSTINGFGIKEDIRYDLVKNDFVSLTPYVEVGAGYYRLTTIENLGENATISSLFSGGSNITNFDNITMTGDIGLDLGFNFKFDDRRLSIIASGGYMTNYPSQWRRAASLAYNEKLNIMSPYAGITLALDMDECKNSACCK